MASHTLADGLIGGAQALWPLTTRFYGTEIRIESLTNISVEWTLFLASLTLLLATKEMWKLLKPHPSNLLLAIPIISIFDSTFLHFPIPVPTQLIIPHLINLAIFTISIFIDLKSHIYNIARAVSSKGPARNNATQHSLAPDTNTTSHGVAKY